jgi:hypothetical protein
MGIGVSAASYRYHAVLKLVKRASLGSVLKLRWWPAVGVETFSPGGVLSTLSTGRFQLNFSSKYSDCIINVGSEEIVWMGPLKKRGSNHLYSTQSKTADIVLAREKELDCPICVSGAF